jgi:hypothetical protein
MIDITLRCFSQARFYQVAVARGIMSGPDAEGRYTANAGFAVDEIGPVVLTPAVIDPQTLAVITPAVMDDWHWVNIRVYGDAFAQDEDTVFPGEEGDTSGFRFLKSKLVRWVRNQATKKTLTYKGVSVDVWEFGAAANRVQLLDPRQYLPIRCREYLGGYMA